MSNAGSKADGSVETRSVRTLTMSVGDQSAVIGVVGTSPLNYVAPAPRISDRVGVSLGVRPNVLRRTQQTLQ